MVELINATVTARSATTVSESGWNSEECAHLIERAKRYGSAHIRLTTSTDTLVPSRGVRLESGFAEGAIDINESSIAVQGAHEPWRALQMLRSRFFPQIKHHTRATVDTSTTVSHIAALLRHHHRDERIRRMSPENRAMYQRIRELREDIGSIRFDVVGAIREVRENG